MADNKVRVVDVLEQEELCQHHPDPDKVIHGGKNKIIFYYHYGNQVCVCGVCNKPTAQCEMEKITRAGFENIIDVKTNYPQNATECGFCPECKIYLDQLINFEKGNTTDKPEVKCDWMYRIAKFISIKRQMAGLDLK